jgi:hypothetical protein
LCPPEHIDAALVQIRAAFGQLTKKGKEEDGPLLFFETQMQEQRWAARRSAASVDEVGLVH